MPNQSCTIILNGHGSYKSTHIINLAQDNIDYNIIFMSKINSSIPDILNNFLLNSLVLVDGGGFLNNLELMPTTYVSNRNIPVQTVQNTNMIDMSSKNSPYTFDHILKNAPDLVNIQTLTDIDNTRFAEQNQIIVDYKVRINWRSNTGYGSFKINYDINQIQEDVLNAYQNIAPQANANIQLSQNNLIYLTPTTTSGEGFCLTLYNLMTDILPKIKIPVKCTIYHQHGPMQNNANPLPDIPNVEVGRTPFLDDGTIPNKFQLFFPNHGQNEIYHEMTIAGDANIIWDSCRGFTE